MAKALDAFEQLVVLKDDPAAFEKKRLEILDEIISSWPEEMQQKARSQQWRLDQELAKHPNPVDKYNTMVELFWKGFAEFQSAHQNPASLQKARPENVVQLGKKK